MLSFGETLNRAHSQRVLDLVQRMSDHPIPGVLEWVPGYSTLMVCYDPMRIEADDLMQQLCALADAQPVSATVAVRRWRMPVCYGGAWGQDLAPVAKRLGLDEQTVIDLHSGSNYRVYMIGFMPGFLYLGELPEALALPRRDVPIERAPAGTVSIAARQAAVMPNAAPTGWYVLGCTPFRNFQPQSTEICPIQAGDEVQFTPIDQSEMQALMKESDAGQWQHCVTLLDTENAQ